MKKTFKRVMVVLSAILIVFTLASCVSVKTPNPVKGEYSGKTVVLHTNDVHGAIDSYAYVAAAKTYYESLGAQVILVDAGDYSQGTIYVSTSKGADAITMLNAVGYDFVTLGNHEFDYGYAQLAENLKGFTGKVLCSNVFENYRTVYSPTARIKVDDCIIGFVGIETPEAQTKANPAMIKGLSFTANNTESDNLTQYVQKIVNKLNTQADVVIAISHLGIDDESVLNRSTDVFKEMTGVDFVIDGHSHSVMTESEDGQKIQSTGTKIENIGVIVVDNASKTVVDNFLIPAADFGKFGKDKEVEAVAKEIIDRVDAEYQIVFADSEVVLDGSKPGNRANESNNGDLITDAMLWSVVSTGAELGVPTENIVAITNGGGIRASIGKGPVTKANINTVLPFGNTISLVYVTGAELLEALEASTFCTPTAVGGFPQISGMKITIDTKKPFDQGEIYPASTYYQPKSINRVTIDSINGKPFDPNAEYAVITNNFCAAGGDTYYAFARAFAAGMTFDTGATLDVVVMSYISEVLGGVIGKEYAAPQGRITIKK